MEGHNHEDSCEAKQVVSIGDPDERPSRKPMRFVSLHHHSTYSYLDGYQMPEAHVRRAEELGMQAMALTEHGNTSSITKLDQACKGSPVKPIFGVELYTGSVEEETKKQRKNHLTILAENQQGYTSMLRTVSQSYRDFYYEPTTSWSSLRKNKAGLIVLSGCTGSLLATSLVGGKLVAPEDASLDKGMFVARKFKEEFGDNYYLEVQAFPELENVCRINKMILEISQKLKIPIVATADIHYTRPSENEMQQILHNVRGGNRQTLEDQARAWGYDVPLSHPVNDNTILRRLIATGMPRQDAINAILMSEEIASRCVVSLPRLPPLRFPLPAGFSSGQQVWDTWIQDGWKFRGYDRLSAGRQREIRKQLNYEMKIIEDKDFIDYFLVVSDMVKFAKEALIPVGPARGSAASSIVCYLLRITEVNPIEFPDLVFERFIEPTRKDLPDIDLDFDSERRHEIRNYLVAKYGERKVSNIGTFSFYKSKNSLDDVARVFRIPIFEVDKIKELLLERSSGDLRSSATIEDTVEMFEQAAEVVEKYPDLKKAMDLEGNVKQFGVHAAGLVVSSGDIQDVMAVYERKVNGRVIDAVAVDKEDAELLNMLKIDVLGLSTMTMISKALEIIKMDPQELYDMPLDDKEVIDGFRRNDVVGIFQFDGRAMRSVNAELQPDSFKEICDVNALARPGPLHNNASAEYIDTKRGRKKPRRFHPLCDEITKTTQYQIVYQEQIMKICGEIGGFDHTHRATIRKIISHKHGEQEFNSWWERFRDGAADRGVPESVARDIWGACITAGSYAFCLTGDAEVESGGAGSNGGRSRSLETLWEQYNSRTSLGQKLRGGQNGKRINLMQMDDDGRLRPDQFLSIRRSNQPVIVREVKTNGGKSFKGSMAHRVMTTEGYRELRDLNVGDSLVTEDLDYVYKQPRKHESSERSGNWDDGRTSWYADGRSVHLKEAHDQTRLRAKGACEHCGKIDDGSKHCLEFAHIFSLDDFGGDWSRYNNANNIMHLCNSCHKNLDYRKGERRVRHSVGRPTSCDEVVSVQTMEKLEYVYMVDMNNYKHNFVANGIVHHNNVAHSIAYGMLAYWTMWLKQYHPVAFYVASLNSYSDSKQLDLLRDAAKHGLEVLPPHPAESSDKWRVSNNGNIRAGFSQIPGIGPTTADRIVKHRDEYGLEDWEDLIMVTGIGKKTISKMLDFCNMEDPFEIHKLSRTLTMVRDLCGKGDFIGVPEPTHTSLQVPYSRGEDELVIWSGVIVHRNLRELFEVNFSRTGVPLDPDTVKDPHLNEWVILLGLDEEEMLTISLDRWKYPKFKDAIWSIKLNHDVLVVKGIKRGYQSRRAIYAHKFWIIDPD